MAVGDETAHASRDSAPISILRPFDRGYITNWEPEFEVRSCVIPASHVETTVRAFMLPARYGSVKTPGCAEQVLCSRSGNGSECAVETIV